MVRLRVSVTRLRIIRLRLRMRLSALAFVSWVCNTTKSRDFKNEYKAINMKQKGVHLRAVQFSGNSNNGSNAGLSYSNANNSASNTNANIGSHLSL